MEVGGPQRGLVASHSLADLDDHVLAVGGIRRSERDAQFLLEGADPVLQLGNHLAEDAVAARRLQVLAHLTPLLCETVRPLELLEAASRLSRLPVVVVDGRVGHALLRLLVRAFQLVD
jgi:hypothetical protein